MEVNYIQHTGSDLAVVNAARVSFDKESRGQVDYIASDQSRVLEAVVVPTEKDKRLIRYLAKHKHTSPFNHSFITLRVKAPLFVARQLVKHKFMTWNEVSRRYVDSEPEFYVPEGWRSRAENVKQGSGEVFVHSLYGPTAQAAAVLAYKGLLEDGVCPEQARMVLPQSMYTEWYWSGTLGAWADMYKLRIDAHSQRETQEVAAMCGDIIAPLFPVSWKELTHVSL